MSDGPKDVDIFVIIIMKDAVYQSYIQQPFTI